jgi:hypothetical protein
MEPFVSFYSEIKPFVNRSLPLKNDRRFLNRGWRAGRAVQNLHALPRVPVKRRMAKQSDVSEIVARLEHSAFGLDALLSELRGDRVKLALQLARPTEPGS